MAWEMIFEREDLKALRRDLDRWQAPYPEELTPDLERYIKVYRPCLLYGNGSSTAIDSKHLFLTKYGKRLHEVAIYRMFRRWGHRVVGKHVHPHLVRSVVEEALLLRFSGNPIIVADCLGITVETALEHYNPLKVRDSVRFWDELRRVPAKVNDDIGVAAEITKAATLLEEIAKLSPRRRASLLAANHRSVEKLVAAIERLGLGVGTQTAPAGA